MTNAIGLIKAKKTVYCSICNNPYVRTATSKVFILGVYPKEELTNKLNKDYTCNVCKSIVGQMK